ncbi:STAS/SEC14 domain-containing protein [Pontibacter qinzhouensis]|uniref:STAS/SEC14 domain-containing protein n=1 Tax=Pontibacter qinzhouensis TaxID=2603253 RepID=A0A5C8J736_9BACT|nr:STAS/SEC14 domain-containing protein [Pontibacter qinzhouensis]TXK33241.1 STAS/SEC14 domain-containing protein [Pontibacter qinzhouensis]
MLQVLEESRGDLFAVQLSGHIDKQDYNIMLPMLEEKIKQHGKIDVLAEVADLKDVSLEALWEEIKFDFRHAADFRKVAVVGEPKWLDWLTLAASPFTTAKIKHFPPQQRLDALNWIKEQEV